VDNSDRTYPIRRGFLLRSLIERRVPRLKSGERLQVDDGVLNALLTVPRYRHGVRSMEALLAMSALTGRTQFERAALPPTDQLELHVDGGEFMALVHGERLDDGLRDRLGVLLHEAYRVQRLEIAKKDGDEEQVMQDPSMCDWQQLAEELRESNRLQADDIPRKLRTIGCFMAPPIAGREPVETFSAKETVKLAKLEHERYNAERLRRHWRLGERDIPRHVSPFLVPWRDVPKPWRSLDCAAVKAIPSALRAVELRVYRVRRAVTDD
jgi:hypothetical protein